MTIPISILIAGLIAVALCLHSIWNMGRSSVWPTVVLGLLGFAMIFESATLVLVKVLGG